MVGAKPAARFDDAAFSQDHVLPARREGGGQMAAHSLKATGIRHVRPGGLTYWGLSDRCQAVRPDRPGSVARLLESWCVRADEDGVGSELHDRELELGIEDGRAFHHPLRCPSRCRRAGASRRERPCHPVPGTAPPPSARWPASSCRTGSCRHRGPASWACFIGGNFRRARTHASPSRTAPCLRAQPAGHDDLLRHVRRCLRRAVRPGGGASGTGRLLRATLPACATPSGSTASTARAEAGQPNQAQADDEPARPSACRVGYPCDRMCSCHPSRSVFTAASAGPSPFA